MKKISVIAFMVLCIFILSGIANAKFMFGVDAGIAVKGGTTFQVGPRLGFGLGKYIVLGFDTHFWHVSGGDFGESQNAILGGLIMEYHIVAGKLPIVDPYLAFGGGVGYNFSGGAEGESNLGGYGVFAGALDIGIPGVPIKPYAEVGVHLDGFKDAFFLLRGGIKLEL